MLNIVKTMGGYVIDFCGYRSWWYNKNRTHNKMIRNKFDLAFYPDLHTTRINAIIIPNVKSVEEAVKIILEHYNKKKNKV